MSNHWLCFKWIVRKVTTTKFARGRLVKICSRVSQSIRPFTSTSRIWRPAMETLSVFCSVRTPISYTAMWHDIVRRYFYKQKIYLILVFSRAISKHLKPEQGGSSHIYVISGFDRERRFRIARSETFLSWLKVKKNWQIFFANIFYSDYKVSIFGMSLWGVE